MSERSPACQACPPERRRLGRVRGMCHTCYTRNLNLVRAGLVTWKELHEQGLCTLTPEEQGKKRNSLFVTRPAGVW